MDLGALMQCVVSGDGEGVVKLVDEGLRAGVHPETILNEGLVAAMDVVGQKYESGDFFLPEMLCAAMAMKAGMQVLKPGLAGSRTRATGVVVIGTVQGDIHDIGKNLVATMLEGAGFEVTDLGTDVRPERFVEVVKERKPDIVGLSALLNTTMPAIQQTIEAFLEAGIRKDVKVIIGGAPVTEGFADQVGADAYAPDAASAVAKARELLGYGEGS